MVRWRFLVGVHFGPFVNTCRVRPYIIDVDRTLRHFEELFKVSNSSLLFIITALNILSGLLLYWQLDLLVGSILVVVDTFLHHVLDEIHVFLVVILLGLKLVIVLFTLISLYRIHYVLQVVIQ